MLFQSLNVFDFSDGSNIAVIAGGTSGAVVVIIFLSIVIIILLCKRTSTSNTRGDLSKRSNQTQNTESTQNDNPPQANASSDPSREGTIHGYETLKHNDYDKIWKASSKPQDGIRGRQSHDSSHVNTAKHGYDNEGADIHYEEIRDSRIAEYLELT